MNDEERLSWGFRPWAAGGRTISETARLLREMPGSLLDPRDKWGNPIPDEGAVFKADLPSVDERWDPTGLDAPARRPVDIRMPDFRSQAFDGGTGHGPPPGDVDVSAARISTSDPWGGPAGRPVLKGLLTPEYAPRTFDHLLSPIGPYNPANETNWPPTHLGQTIAYFYGNEAPGNGPVDGRAGLNKWGYLPQSGDREALAKGLYFEMRGNAEAYPQTARSIINRADPNSRYRRTIAEVLAEEHRGIKQFQSYGTKEWNSFDPSKLTAADRAAYDRALKTADDALYGGMPDMVRGGTDFYSDLDAVGRPPPYAGHGKPAHGLAENAYHGRSLKRGTQVPTWMIGNTVFMKPTR